MLYLPDELIVVDHRRERAVRRRYDFEVDGSSHATGCRASGRRAPYAARRTVARRRDHAPGEYARDGARRAKESFKRGDLFEVVPGQTFLEPCPAPPSELFRRLRERNPAPYGFLLNLGEGEHLVGASPEMYVRVERRPRRDLPDLGHHRARRATRIDDAAQILHAAQLGARTSPS